MVRQRSPLILYAFLTLMSSPPAAVQAANPCVVRANVPWTDCGIWVKKGETIRFKARGKIHAVGLQTWDWLAGRAVDREVSPQGTYAWPRTYLGQDHHFPLPAIEKGPFPAFCLIGKVTGDQKIFYVGLENQIVAQASGKLLLGINDDHFEDNGGAFEVTVNEAAPGAVAAPWSALVPPDMPEISAQENPDKQPIAAARVLLIYVDGLRLDVLLEMASGGFLPNLKRVFLDRGLLVPNAFSVFPSNTLIANGALFTGRFPDRTGIKSQNQFERATLKPIVQFSRWLPDGFFPQPHTRVINLLDKYAPENTHGFLIKRGVPTMATYLGKSFRWTTLPIAPLNPPPQWFHRAINTIGPLKWTSNLPWRLDTVNAQYAVEELIGDPDARVIAVWFPMLDKVSHHSLRGQFGAARRELALVDRYLGRILQRLKQVGWESSTYLILLSDHGHMGGKEGVNQICNLPRDWGHQVLGCNAKVVGQEWLHPGIDPSRILFFDNQGSGQAKLFLPYGSYWRGAWRRNRLYELTHYYLRPSQRSVNLLESLANFHPPHWNGDGPKPVDLILVKLDEERTLVYRGPSNQAIIYRTKGNDSQEYYRYEPVQQLWQSEDGSIEFRMPQPGVDPLGYLKDPHFLQATGGKQWLKEAHLANEWLHATFKTRYPDAVVLMAKFFAWSPPLKDLASLRDPDLLVTASEGWSFRSDNELGTDHGYPLADSMRITLSLSGPNIAHGALQNPQRIVDILPTVLQMVGKQYDTGQMDGELIAGIYE